jgi:hypothetical protein
MLCSAWGASDPAARLTCSCCEGGRELTKLAWLHNCHVSCCGHSCVPALVLGAHTGRHAAAQPG